MILLRVRVPPRLHRAVHVVPVTALDFDLDSRVGDSEMVIQLLIDRAEHVFALLKSSCVAARRATTLMLGTCSPAGGTL